MGGQNETIMPTKTVEDDGNGKSKILGQIRYHLKGSEVHFHNDSKGVKITVPVADWFKGWQDLDEGKIEEWTYTDISNRTFLKVRLFVTDDLKLDISVSVDLLGQSDDLVALAQFTTQGDVS